MRNHFDAGKERGKRKRERDGKAPQIKFLVKALL